MKTKKRGSSSSSRSSSRFTRGTKVAAKSSRRHSRKMNRAPIVPKEQRREELVGEPETLTPL